ncbi:hypothetical protein LJC36_06290, partial [Desulfovibrio sp. OttesenSCG-928-C14]|nr:hypothetical protein [Desulfovibrio sp. OttesenSCG-928-C14]
MSEEEFNRIELSASLDIELLHKAAMHGEALAQRRLALMYDLEYIAPKDTAKAVYWFKKLAEEGDREALSYLKVIREEYYPELDDIVAQFVVGYMYYGAGMNYFPKSKAMPQAMHWIKKAAER